MQGADIDSFIQQQKAKLANERQHLDNTKPNQDDYRKLWREQNGVGPTLKVELSRDPADGLFKYERGLEKEAYQEEWRRAAVHRDLEPGDQRKKWEAPVKLSPRGYLDTDVIVTRVQRDEPLVEYKAKWRKEHGNRNQGARLQGPDMTRRDLLNTDSIVDKVAGEKIEQDYSPRRQGHKGLSTGLYSNEETGNYRKTWEENKGRNQDELMYSPRSQKRRDVAILIREDGRSARLKKMQEERNKEYNILIAQKRGQQGTSILQQQTDDYKANSMPSNESDNAKWQKIKERNDEYNQFLANKNERDKNRFSNKKAPEPQDGKFNNSILGISSSSATKRRMEEERNKEYNDMIQKKGQRNGRQPSIPPPKQGWGTPDYQELLDKSRAREQNFRRANDIAYEADPQTRYDYREAVTDDRTVPLAPASRRSRDYYASLPLGGDSETAQRRQKEEYRNDLQRQMAQASQARQIERQEGLLVNKSGLANPQSSRVPQERRRNPMDYNAIIAGAGIDDDQSPRTNAILGRRQDTADRRRFRGLNGGLGGQRSGNADLDLGVLQTNNVRTNNSLEPPAGLLYQPSTFVTANAGPIMNNSVDEAYNFYATKNPLDPDMKNEVVHAFVPGSEVVRGGPTSVPGLNLTDVTNDASYGPRARQSEFRGNRANPAVQGMTFGTDDDKKTEQRHNANEYREELERQIAEKNMKKRLAKEEHERYEMRMEAEAKSYDPFGKGGGGAPMRDQKGNVITDLRQMRNDNIGTLTGRSYRDPSPPRVGFALDTGPGGNISRARNSYRDDLIGPPPTQTTADGEASHARGGHGIFGMPKTDVEKLQADKYKLDLKKQIEEKKADDFRKKQMEKMEEEKEQRQLEEQRQRMQSEYDEEQRRINDKKEEARLKNEEMMKATEEKKRELDRQRREEDEQRQQEMRDAHGRELRDRQMAEENLRGKSPPVPVLQGKDKDEEQIVERKVAESPPIPAARTRAVEPDLIHNGGLQDRRESASRAQSADVLNQLTRLRTELRKESDRVQTMLHDQQDDVEIYDPRHMHRPPPAPVLSLARPEIDVFETAMNRNAVTVRRTPGDRASSTVMNDFTSLKHKNDSDSRKQFRNLYPTEPMSNSALEAQQAALLRQQEERLHIMKERRALEDTSALRIGRDLHSSSSQLHSNSAFVDVNGMNQFPDDFEDLPKRNDSARYRRRTRVPSSPRFERFPTPEINSRSTFGSQTSLNVDKLARKNEDRLRKLRDMQGDDLSLYDPEDVLNRFMSKQDHNRMELEDIEIDSRLGDTSPAFSTPVS